MARSITRRRPGRSLPRLALVAALVPPFASTADAQCVGDVVDALYTPLRGTDARAVDGNRIVLGHGVRLPAPPTLEVFEAHPVTGEFLYAETIAPPEWQPASYVTHIGLEGDLMAFQFHKGFGGPHEVDILERGAQGWTRTGVALPEAADMRLGEFTAVADGRVYTLTARVVGRPISLHEIVKDPAGSWSIAQSLRLGDAEMPYFESPVTLQVEGDVAVISGALGPANMAVVVCARDATGRWQQVDLIGPPSGFPILNSVDLGPDRLTLLHRSDYFPDGSGTLRVFEPAVPGGPWALVEQFDVATMFGSDIRWVGPSDGGRTTFGTTRGTALFTRLPSLGFRRTWNVEGSWPVDLDGDRLATSNLNRLVMVVEVPINTGPTETVTTCSLAGRTTCQGSGSTRLRIHETWLPLVQQRRTVAEVAGVPAGAPIAVFRSTDPAFATTVFGDLCIDRRTATAVGPPKPASAAGTATFTLGSGNDFQASGFAAADHLQAIVLGAAPELSNAIAWLP
ncbi:MAG: hypothetical protein AAF957_23515 [Planctomycetota bacterium]